MSHVVRMVVRGRGSSWLFGLLGTVGFGLVTVVICLFVNAQPDSLTYMFAHTDTLGAVVCSVWLVGALVISYLAGLASGHLGSGVVAGLVMGGLSGLTYTLITNTLSPYWYGTPIAWGPWPLFFSIVVVGVILGVFGIGIGALVGLLGGSIGAIVSKHQ
jgi:hypothetical protein